MKREFCDRCNKDVTGSATLDVVDIPTGDIKDSWTSHELCKQCLRALRLFVERLSQEA